MEEVKEIIVSILALILVVGLFIGACYIPKYIELNTQDDVEITIKDKERVMNRNDSGSKYLIWSEEGEVSAVSFKMLVNDEEIGFQLPITPEKVLAVLRSQRRVEPRYKTAEQAKRVAWRIVKDWVEAQLAIIETQMVKPEQIFLPYAITQTGETLYEAVISNSHLLGEKYG